MLCMFLCVSCNRTEDEQTFGPQFCGETPALMVQVLSLIQVLEQTAGFMMIKKLSFFHHVEHQYSS